MWTGDVRGAGTNADIFLQMYGDDGKTEEYVLRDKTDRFERGQVDKFKVCLKLHSRIQSRSSLHILCSYGLCNLHGVFCVNCLSLSFGG